MNKELNIQDYKRRYIDWLENELNFVQVGEFCEINAPFLDHNNDYLQFYIKQADGQILFTDDGGTLQALISEGLTLSSARKAQLNSILRSYGVKLSGTALTTESSLSDFPQKKHMFMQAMLKVDDLYMTIKTKSGKLFTDEIAGFFKSNGIYCTPDIQICGESGFAHNYDFLIQQSKDMPTRLCIGINTPSRSNTENVLFSWLDTKQARKGENDMLIVFLNDEHTIGKNVIEGLRAYQATPILWSEISQSDIKLLSA